MHKSYDDALKAREELAAIASLRERMGEGQYFWGGKMNDELKNIEQLARLLCEARWGEGSWTNRKGNRSYWRRQAKQAIAKLREQFTERELV